MACFVCDGCGNTSRSEFSLPADTLPPSGPALADTSRNEELCELIMEPPEVLAAAAAGIRKAAEARSEEVADLPKAAAETVEVAEKAENAEKSEKAAGAVSKRRVGFSCEWDEPPGKTAPSDTDSPRKRGGLASTSQLQGGSDPEPTRNKKGLNLSFAKVEVETVPILDQVDPDNASKPVRVGAISRCVTIRKAVTTRLEEETGTVVDRTSVTTTLPVDLDPHKGLRRKESVATVVGQVHEHYEMERKLGEGGFGTIMLVKNLESGARYAMKIINHSKVVDDERFELELSIFRKLQHPHIVKLHESLKDTKCYFLVMELCTGGDLFDKIISSCERITPMGIANGLQSGLVARYLWQMLSGIAYLHHYKFAHRDIKPENYMLATPAPDAPLKLIDFGLARAFQPHVPMSTCVGSAYYMAPEVVDRRNYDEKCDIWSIGACVYTCSVGCPPFPGHTEQDIFQGILQKDLDFTTSSDWKRHPLELKELLQMLMRRNPAERPAAKKVIASSEWLRTHAAGPIGSQGCCAVL